MGLDGFLSLGGHLLAPFLFHEVTSLHPPSFQKNDFSTCFTYLSAWGKAPIKMMVFVQVQTVVLVLVIRQQ